MILDLAAETIAEEVLYITGKAILEEDDDMFIASCALPHLMETSKGRHIITTEAELSDTLSSVRLYMKRNDIVDLVRTVVSARFIDADTIESTHVSLMLGKNGETTRSPYPVYSVIRRFGSSWKIVSSLYAILDNEEHNNALLSGGKLWQTEK